MDRAHPRRIRRHNAKPPSPSRNPVVPVRRAGEESGEREEDARGRCFRPVCFPSRRAADWERETAAHSVMYARMLVADWLTALRRAAHARTPSTSEPSRVSKGPGGAGRT